MDQQIFAKACLGKLSIACWQGSKMLAPTQMAPLGDSDWLRAKKYLVNPERLHAIKAVASRARMYLHRKALPFPINGLSLIPKDALADIDAALRELQQEFWQEVETFLSLYDFARAEAKRHLGDLFSETDYPVDIRAKFHFRWQFLTLQVPGKHTLLSPELYAQEKEKFLALMEETRELAILALRQEFRNLLDHLVDRLSGREDGKPKQFKATMIQKLHDFLADFETRNIFQDQELATLVAQAKAIIAGVDPDLLRQDAFLREHVAGAMQRLQDAMAEQLEDLPRRRLRFAA